MKIFSLLLFLLAAALPASAQTTNHGPWCCRYPLRVMGPGAGVNLKPLFEWWNAHGGQTDPLPGATSDTNVVDAARPLTAWKRITGEKTGGSDTYWVIDARVYSTPTSWTNEWIVVRHPPATEEQQFYYLLNLIAQDTEQITNDARLYNANMKIVQKEDARIAQANSSYGKFAEENSAYSKTARTTSAVYGQRAAEYHKTADAAQADEKQFEAGREEARRQYLALPGERGQYKIDLFALDRGRNDKGQNVFDAGEMYAAPQQ